MADFYSFDLTEFNLDGQIKLGGVMGLIKLLRSDDGRLILVTDGDYYLIDQEKPSLSHIVEPASALGFVLDIGVRKEKILTHGSGFYFGTKLLEVQSSKKISQSNFDKALLEKIDTSINGYFRSGDLIKESAAMRIRHLLDGYNNCRLLFPNFYNDSYLGFMRILDAFVKVRGGCCFATAISLISPDINKAIYDLLAATYPERIEIAERLFSKCLRFALKEKLKCHAQMSGFNEPAKVIFSCFFSAYQYRNKFVHQGFPFPDIVKEGGGRTNENGTDYLNPALGAGLFKIHRPDGYQDGDSIDIHAVITDPMEAAEFQDIYFLLIPNWHFLKRITRAALIKLIDDPGSI